MSTVTLPQARSPLGWTVVNGVRTAVEIDVEWMRALIDLVGRTGGTSGGGGTVPAGFENTSQLLAGDMFSKRPAAQPDVRGDSSITATRDAQGFQLALVSENLVSPLLPFLPRLQTASLLDTTDASRVLENQIFGA